MVRTISTIAAVAIVCCLCQTESARAQEGDRAWNFQRGLSLPAFGVPEEKTRIQKWAEGTRNAFSNARDRLPWRKKPVDPLVAQREFFRPNMQEEDNRGFLRRWWQAEEEQPRPPATVQEWMSQPRIGFDDGR